MNMYKLIHWQAVMFVLLCTCSHVFNWASHALCKPSISYHKFAKLGRYASQQKLGKRQDHAARLCCSAHSCPRAGKREENSYRIKYTSKM